MGLSMSLSGLGESSAAADLISQLAPEDEQVGYAPAHLVVAERLLAPDDPGRERYARRPSRI